MWRAILAGLVLTVPQVALAAPTTFVELASLIVGLLNQATALLIAIAIVAFLYGGIIHTYKAGEEGGAALRKFLLWGVFIITIMVSIWGILELLQSTFFGAGGGVNTSGSSGANGISDIYYNI